MARHFPKLSVKVREEIVTGNLGVCDIDPNVVTGKTSATDRTSYVDS